MTTKPTLSAQKRDVTGKGGARKLRAGGQIPAVMYGQDADALALTIDAHDAEHLFRSITVENTIIGLKVEGQRRPIDTLVREIQAHPVRGDILHVDFLRLKRGVAIELDIPVQLEGTPVGVKDRGGMLEQLVHDIRVRCLPADIPEVVELDVTGLGVGDSLHVSDIVLGGEVEILDDPERLVCLVEVRRVVEEVAVAEVEEAIEEGAPEEAEEEAAADSDG